MRRPRLDACAASFARQNEQRRDRQPMRQENLEMMMAIQQLIGGGSHIAQDAPDRTGPRHTAGRGVGNVVNLMCGLSRGCISPRSRPSSNENCKTPDCCRSPRGVEQASPRILAPDLLRETLREVRRAHGQKPAVVFCDGLDKYSADKAQEILNALLPFQTEACWSSITASLVLRARELRHRLQLRLFRNPPRCSGPGRAWAVGDRRRSAFRRPSSSAAWSRSRSSRPRRSPARSP